jgi:1-acyl-sn-glycerol-3-phosphate acyltransferase
MKAYAVLARPIRFFQRIKTTGLENVPKDDKGYIICSNHIGAKDVIMIGAVYHKQIRFIAKKELFKIPLLGSLIKALGAIKLDRGGNDVTAIKTAVSLAESGETVAIFPQGHRYPSVNPATTTPKNGAGLIAYRSGCDVIPVCIKVKNQKYRIFRKIDIIFGRPIKNENLGFTNGGTDEYRAASEKIFSEILSLGGYTLEEEKSSYNGDNT